MSRRDQQIIAVSILPNIARPNLTPDIKRPEIERHLSSSLFVFLQNVSRCATFRPQSISIKMTELEKYIQTNFSVTTDELAQIIALFKPITLRKGDFYLKAGRYSDRLGFVQSGIIREFVDRDDKQITKWISTEGYFAVDIHSFYFREPARWNIQALTDCQIYTIDINDYRKIDQMIPRWTALEKLFIAKCFAALEDRIIQHISMSAETRYTQFFHANRELFNQVPLQYIASMLGMTPETLSRLRKKAGDQSS